MTGWREAPAARSGVTRRRLLAALGGAAGAALLGCAGRDETDPGGAADPRCRAVAGRTIRWIVPNAPGGGYDTDSRAIKPFLEKGLNAQIAVENIAGAGGITGARAIMAARPDGLTLGMVGAPGLLIAAMTGQTAAPRPQDLTILGRFDRSWHVWVTAPQSPLRTIADVVGHAASRPLLFSLNEVGSATFVSMSVAAAILGIDIELVAGFAGTRSEVLAALRGEVDMVCLNYDNSAHLIRTGELRPILQISDRDVSTDPALRGVATLGGENGMAQARAEALGGNSDEAVQRARALIAVIGAGRLIVAPPHLPAAVFGCLSQAVHGTLSEKDLIRAAGHPIDVAPAEVARAAVTEAAAHAPLILPIVEAAVRRLRR